MKGQSQDDKPIAVNERRTVTVPLVLLVGLLMATITATMGWAAVRSDAQEAKSIANAAAARIASLETAIGEVRDLKRDVEWIVRTMDEDRRNGRRQTQP